MTSEDLDREEKVLQLLVDHARYRWSAEEENARRLSTRAGQLFTLITALLVLGLFKVAQGSPLPEGLRGTTIQIAVGLATFFLLWALKELLRVTLSWLHPRVWWPALRSSRWWPKLRPREWGPKLNPSVWWPKIWQEQAVGEGLEGRPLEAPEGLGESPLASTLLAWPEELLPNSAAWIALDMHEALDVQYLSVLSAAERLHESNLGAATANGRAQERLFAVGVLLGLVLLCYLYNGTGPSPHLDPGGASAVAGAGQGSINEAGKKSESHGKDDTQEHQQSKEGRNASPEGGPGDK